MNISALALCSLAGFLLAGIASAEELTASDQPVRQLTLADLKTFNDNEANVPEPARKDIAMRIKAETGLEKPRAMPFSEKKKILAEFNKGKAGKYTVQQLVDAGVFKFKPIVNLHPNCMKTDDDKLVRPRDGRELEIDNAVWGKKNVAATLLYGVMHSTEDGGAGAARTVDMWNADGAAGKRSSSAPFVVGRTGNDIYVTADFESRWQRHCSSKLTARPGLVNWSSVGVEMEHSTEKNIDYTDGEILTSARLWTYIQERAGIPDYRLVTHTEIQGYLPKDHISFRSDPEGFNWLKFGQYMMKLRRAGDFEPPPSPVTEVKTIPQVVLQMCGEKFR